MEYVNLNKNCFAEKSGWIKCYVTDYSGEYIGQRDEYISVTTGLPAGAYIDCPPLKTETSTVFRGVNGWEIITDNRGKDAFCCENGEVSKIDYLGELRQGFTLMAPATPYDTWDGEKWVTDPAVQQQALIADALHQKETLLSRATQHIALWQTKLLMGRKLSDADAASLNAWLDYIDALQAVDISTLTLRAGVVWPDAPALQSAQVSKKE